MLRDGDQGARTESVRGIQDHTASALFDQGPVRLGDRQYIMLEFGCQRNMHQKRRTRKIAVAACGCLWRKTTTSCSVKAHGHL